MLNFEFPITHPIEEALIGNVHRFDIKISKLKNINLQNMMLEIENLPSEGEKLKEISNLINSRAFRNTVSDIFNLFYEINLELKRKNRENKKLIQN
jgi:hypothetical protein